MMVMLYTGVFLVILTFICQFLLQICAINMQRTFHRVLLNARSVNRYFHNTEFLWLCSALHKLNALQYTPSTKNYLGCDSIIMYIFFWGTAISVNLP